MLTIDLHHPHTKLKTVSYYSQLPSITVCGEDEVHVVPNPLPSLLPSPDSKDGHAGSLSPKESHAVTEFMEKFAKEYMLTLTNEFNEEKEATVVALCKLPKPVEHKGLSNNTDTDPFSAVFGVLAKRKDANDNVCF